MAGNMGDTSDDDVREGGGMLTDKNETGWWSHDDSSEMTTSCCWFGSSLITEKEADDAGSCCWFGLESAASTATIPATVASLQMSQSMRHSRFLATLTTEVKA